MKKIRLLILLSIIVILFLGIQIVTAQEPGILCLPQYHCVGGDCENGVLDAYRLDVPDDFSVCVVDFFFSGSSIPVSRLGNGCDRGLCTFGMPFGPTLRAYSQPHDPGVVGIRVWTEPRRRNWLSVLFRNFTPPKTLSIEPYPPPYPYP